MMRHTYLFTVFLVVLMIGCNDQSAHESRDTEADIPDLNKVGLQCDSLREAGKPGEAASLYYKTAITLGSPELFTYAAWQYGLAGHHDSALRAVDLSIDHGMCNPNILKVYELGNSDTGTVLRKRVDQRLDSIRQALKRIENFEIDSAPIEAFWHFFDKAIADTLQAEKYLKEYIAAGSYALKDYYVKRYENTEKMYQQMIRATPDHYKFTQKVLTKEKLAWVKSGAMSVMQHLSSVYPNAVFPKVYIVPGLINSNGTVTEAGLFIGAEMFVKENGMPVEGLSEWQLQNVTPLEDMIYVITHEYMHFQQSYHDTKNEYTLLGKVVQEGVCDFLITLCSGKIAPVRYAKISYLDEPGNMARILADFKKDMYSKDLSKWMYNGGAIHDRPDDLGYAFGYKICKSYYDRATDKKQVITELLNTDNFQKIWEGSEYGSANK